MKRLAQFVVVPLVLGVSLAACSSTPAIKTDPAGAPDGHVAHAAPGPAPKAEPAAPGPDAFRVEPALSLQTVRATRAYTGRGPWYLLVAELPAGTGVEYLGSQEGWLHVRMDSGEAGWMSAADIAIQDGRNQPVAYRVQPGRWEVHADAGPKIELQRVTQGVMRVSVFGAGAPPIQVLSDGSLLLEGAAAAGVEAALDIGDGGVRRVSAGPKGILVELQDGPVHRLLKSDGDPLVLEIRPALKRVGRTPDGWSLEGRGGLRPVLRQEGGQLLLDLPGTLLSREFAALPPGITLEEVGPEGAATTTPQPSSLMATVPARMAAGGLRLRMDAPQGPYALYRTASDTLDLRFLRPGLSGKTIVLDPGHGGEETGAVGVTSGIAEKDVNLAVALLLRPMLERAGARVIMTRTTDARVLPPESASALKTYSQRTQADLALRSAMANQARADLMVSIHANGGPAGDGGIETYWAISNLNASRSQYLATVVQAELVGALGLYNRGWKQRPFNVIRMSEAPGVLIELGFMTNAREERLLISPSGQRAAAEAILRGIQTYFGR